MPIRIFDEQHAAAKAYRAGTHRVRSPADTVTAFRELMPQLGITRLANVTGLDVVGMPVYMAIRPNSRSLSTAQGKGVDHAAAKASALMEAAEGWHAERVELPLRHESYAQLRRSAVVADVSRLPQQAGSRFDAGRPMLWLEGYDIARQHPTWVPFSCVTTNYVVDPLAQPPVFVTGSNGLASGNHVLEAVVHALCEVIERDASTLASFDPPKVRAARRLDLDSVDDRGCRQVIDLVRAAGVQLVVHDVTSDLGVPAYTSLVFDRPDVPRWSLKGFCAGAGCHLDPAVAVTRAITEALQSRLTLIAGSRDDHTLRQYETFADPVAARTAAQWTANELPARSFADRTALATSTFEADIEVLLAALSARGLESVIVVDLRKEAIGIPVVKVVVPGLEGNRSSHSHLSYQPGPRARARLSSVADGR